MRSPALFIDAKFESGNIEKVFKNRAAPSSQEYHMFMNVDTNTRGHQQWFYFRVRNMRTDTKYKFNIWNFTKPKSLFKDGMKPMWFSKKKQKRLGIEKEEDAWEFIPDENIEDLKYYKSDLQRPRAKKGLFAKLFLDDEKDKASGKDDGKGAKKDKDQGGGAAEPKQYVKQFADRAPYYCLTFTVTFESASDTVFIAYSRPYRYSKMLLDMV